MAAALEIAGKLQSCGYRESNQCDRSLMLEEMLTDEGVFIRLYSRVDAIVDFNDDR